MKKILILKNITREGPGLAEACLNHSACTFDIIDLDRGETPPSFDSYAALIVLGGPDSANDITPKIVTEIERIREWLQTGKPYLGICLGLQLLVKAAGGTVIKNPVKEIGFYDGDNRPYQVDLTAEGLADPLCRGLSSQLNVFQLHGETVELTADMRLLGTGRHCRNQIVRVHERAYGIQCHFEVTRPMLAEWLKEDDDLKLLPAQKILNDYDNMRQEYEQTGQMLINNFLSLTD